MGDFADLLLCPGLGPRTLQSLTLVSEVIHGTPSRFSDPARYSFAHGGKDGHPFPVPLKVYDETIRVLKYAMVKARLGQAEESSAIKRLDDQALRYPQYAASLDAARRPAHALEAELAEVTGIEPAELVDRLRFAWDAGPSADR